MGDGFNLISDWLVGLIIYDSGVRVEALTPLSSRQSGATRDLF